MPTGIYIRKPFSLIHRKNLSKALTGKKLSESTKEKIRQSHLGKSTWILGKHHSEATKKKISLKKIGTRHTLQARLKISENQRGCKSHFWRGGKTVDSNGYIRLYAPNHPYRNNNGYVCLHRLIVGKEIGRFLLPEEEVHHINRKKKDNRKINLMAFKSHSAHKKYENGTHINMADIVFDGRKGLFL